MCVGEYSTCFFSLVSMAWKFFIPFFCMALFLMVITHGSSPCTQQCPNSHGHVINCSLVSPSHLIKTTKAISQLQCFDMCIRQPECEFYNFINQVGKTSCQLFTGLWDFDDRKKLVTKAGAIFTWIPRDLYLQWLSPDCPGNKCQEFAPNSFLIGSCKKPLDIAFLLDTSVDPVGNFAKEKQFVSSVLQRFEQSSRYTKAAVIEYNTNATVTFWFNNFTTSSDFTNHLQNIPILSGQTRYDRALQLAESSLFTNQGGARPFAHRVVVLITNNEIRSDADNVLSISELKVLYKSKCIQLFAVGISVNGKTAASKVADTSEHHLLKVDLFNELEAQATRFSNKICTALH